MRLRDESLKTGTALAWIDPKGRSKSRVLVFLVQGAADIEALIKIEAVCRSVIESHGHEGFTWHAVADPGQISLVDHRLYSAEIIRFEACEFQDLDDDQLAELLAPVIDHIVGGDPELLPRVGGAVGGPAEGIQFLNRSSELKDLADAIRGGKSLFLQAPRRMGKTSLMRRLQTQLGGEYATLALNVERDPTRAELAARLRSAQAGESFRTALEGARRDPARVLEESVDALCRPPAKPLVLFVDELVALLKSIRGEVEGEGDRRTQTLAFLSALGGPLERHGARLVVASSVDWLDYLRSELGLERTELPGLFARLERVPIKPLDLDRPECELCRLLLGSGLVAGPDDIGWLDKHVDLTVPYPALRFLDLLLSETHRCGRLGVPDFDRLLHSFLSTTESFDDFDEHLRRKAPDAPQAAETVSKGLDIIAREPFEEGAGEEQVHAVLLSAGPANVNLLQSWLRDTFPVRSSGGRVRFVSRLFRYWWRRQMRDGVANDE
jgi:hypothetical protein